MEKLIFVDKTELSFDAIYVSGSELVITVNNGDFAALETKFSDAANLEIKSFYMVSKSFVDH